ncbi:MAG: hypothetical protein II779_08490, partial [Clostridia bacterium]|nr:hypothetical protein [Clostridia bacterium]
MINKSPGSGEKKVQPLIKSWWAAVFIHHLFRTDVEDRHVRVILRDQLVASAADEAVDAEIVGDQSEGVDEAVHGRSGSGRVRIGYVTDFSHTFHAVFSTHLLTVPTIGAIIQPNKGTERGSPPRSHG